MTDPRAATIAAYQNDAAAYAARTAALAGGMAGGVAGGAHRDVEEFVRRLDPGAAVLDVFATAGAAR